MQATAGQRLHLRLFLEGIEVPVIAAQVQIGINSPATASIQVIPSDAVLNLKPRTMVHLFFWDFEESLATPAVLNTTKTGTGATKSTDAELKGYKLLFCGELIGIAFNKSPVSRQMVLQCSDFSTYWDTTYQIMISYSPNGNFLWEQSSIWAGGSSMFDNIMSGHGQTLASYLSEAPKTPGLGNIKGLMGGVIALLEAMGGVPKHEHGVNDFFTIGEIKNHILQQICVEQNDDTAKRLFSSQQFWKWLLGGASSLGELCTFRDMLMLLFKYIFYEVVPNPCAMYIPMQKAYSKAKVVQTGGKVTLPSDVQADIRYMIQTAQNFANQTANLSPDTITNVATKHYTYFNKFQKLDTIPAQVKALLTRAELQLNEVMKNLQFEHMPKLWSNEATLLSKALNFGYPRGTRTINEKIGAELDRLHTQIFRPDCFFAAPPRCNVLFPDQYMQFSYNRAFLREITRLRLSIGWFLNPGGEGILGQSCFAPAMVDIKANAKKQGLNGLRGLLPWELYTGILPKFEHTNEMLYCSNNRDQKLRKGMTGAAIEFSQRVANFNYMKYRFAARSIEVLAKFSPRMVCGFPALVLDRPFILSPDKVLEIYGAAETQKDLAAPGKGDFISRFKIMMDKLAAVNYTPPTQYLGQVAGLAHSVDQKGGYTSVSITHGHTHRLNDDDFLSLWAKQKSQGTTKLAYTKLSAFEIIERGEFDKFKLLLAATPQTPPTAQQQGQAAQNSNSIPPGSRPTGSPNVSNLPTDEYDKAFSLLQVAGAAPPAPTVPPPQTSGGTSFGEAPMRGAVNPVKFQLPGTSQKVDVPKDPVPIVGKKGAYKSGKVVAVQLCSDAIWKFDKSDITKFKKANQGAIKKLFKKNKDLYLWVNCILWEEVPDKDKLSRDIPVEESLRPPWFSPLYSSLFIGDQIYTPFFGCGSIVDEGVFAGAGTVGIFGANRVARDNIMAAFKSAQGDLVKVREALVQAQQNNIADIPSVEQAVDVLAYIYGEVRRMGQDVQRFVTDYTYRPIASMYDIFGSSDLEYIEKPGAGGLNTLEIKADSTGKKGTPGFHSTAIAPYKNLTGLLDNPDLELPRLFKKGGKKAPVSLIMDPRPGRRAKVEAYQKELEEGHGVIGSALRG